jgi:hypothetical protein
VNCTIYGGIVCCSSKHKHLAQGQSIPNHKSSKATGGRGCVSGCEHLALELSCPGTGAIPASCLPNQASGVCWQDPLMLGQASKPSCLGSECKPQTQNKHSWVRPQKDLNPNPIGSGQGPSPQPSWLMTAKDPHPNALGSGQGSSP